MRVELPSRVGGALWGASGGAGAKERGGGHYRVTAVAACFGGMPLVARHRKVYALMGDRMRAEVHALALDLRAPGE